MRYLNGVLFVGMLAFIGLQYNDPDGPLWMAIYLVPAIWTGLAVVRPGLLAQTAAQVLHLLSIGAAVAGVVYYWPSTPGWWTGDVWIEVEAVREGMGLMIVVIVLLIAWMTGRIWATANKNSQEVKSNIPCST